MKNILIVACVVLTCGSAVVGIARRVEAASVRDVLPLQNADIVVRGTVLSVKEATVRSADFWMLSEGNPSVDSPVAFVTLRVLEVLRGPALSSEWSFMVYQPEDLHDAYPVGKEMVICAYYHRRLDVYYHTAAASRYEKSGNAWVTGSSTKGPVITDADLRQKIAEVDIANIANEAQLIVEGVVESVDKSLVYGPDSTASELVTLSVRVDEVKKGRIGDAHIKVVVITRGLYSPEWRGEVPSEYKIGQKWLCMLKRNEYGWYPVEGANGFLRFEGANLIYADRVPFWRTRKEVDKVIENSVSREDGK
jgi:hypothetical protein